MNKAVRFLLFLPLLSVCFAAQAEVTVKKVVVQRGVYYRDEDSKCYADISYPQIEGMADREAQKTLNAHLKGLDEELKCDGRLIKKDVKPDPDDVNGGADRVFDRNYTITFQSPDILSLQFTVSAQDGHIFNWTNGVIIDLRTGTILTAEDVFGKENIPAVIQFIQDTLLRLPDSQGDDMSGVRDAVQGAAFIKDNKCDGCTLVVSKEGVKMAFEPMDWRFPDLAIPAKYVVYPALQKLAGNNKKE